MLMSMATNQDANDIKNLGVHYAQWASRDKVYKVCVCESCEL